MRCSYIISSIANCFCWQEYGFWSEILETVGFSNRTVCGGSVLACEYCESCWGLGFGPPAVSYLHLFNMYITWLHFSCYIDNYWLIYLSLKNGKRWSYYSEKKTFGNKVEQTQYTLHSCLSTQAKYLGVTIDSKLSLIYHLYNNHINTISL